MNSRLKIIFGTGIGLIYLSSLTMECYLVDGSASIGSFGLIALLLGWLNSNLIALIWMANPLLISGLLFFLFSKKSKLALILSSIASVLAISFTQIDEIIKDEAGNVGEITEYLLGYWLWITAIFLLTIILIINRIFENKTVHNS